MSKLVALACLFLLGTASAAAEVIPVPSGGNLQEALDRAQPGDRIELQAGARYVGQFKFPAKSGMVTLTTAGTWPDRCVTPTDAPLMATIASAAGMMAFDLYDSQNWTIDAIRFEPNTNGSGEVIGIWRGQNIVLRRLLLDVPADGAQKRFILGNGKNIEWAQSHCSGVWDRNLSDSQCFVAWDGAGPYRILDNFIEAASENVMFGGADSSAAEEIPSDIRIERNLFTKPLAWKGLRRGVKNLLELKAARRVVIRENTFERNWADAQSGRSIVLTPRNQDGKAPWTVVEDVLFEKNVIRDVAAGFNILGYDDINTSKQTTGIVIRDNTIEAQGHAFLVHGDVGRLEIYRNMVTMPDGSVVLSLDAGPLPWAVRSLVWAENVAPGTYIHSPKALNDAALKAYAEAYSLSVPTSEPPPPIDPPPPPPPPLEDKIPPVILSLVVARSSGANYRVTAGVEDNVGVSQVFFYVDGRWQAGTSAPSTGTSFTSYVKLPKGKSVVRVVVWDGRGNTAEQSKDMVR